MNIELRNSESLIKQGSANHWQGWEAVGGRLFLTDQRLVFKSHKVNVQKHEISMELEEVVSIKQRNNFLLVPNGISIFLQNGHEEQFVVWSRKDWINKIRQAKLTRGKALKREITVKNERSGS